MESNSNSTDERKHEVPEELAHDDHEFWWLTALKRAFEFRWDSDAKVWVITSPDIPGLTIEADSIPDGLRKTADVVPWLMGDDGGPK